MTKSTIALAACLCCFLNTRAQKYKYDHVTIAFTTLHTAFPFSSFTKLITSEYHPGLELGTGFNWKTSAKHDWFQAFQLGYSYHRFVQYSIALYTETGYRYKFPNRFSAEAKIGAGYQHAIAVGKIYKLKEDGTYEKKTNLGRMQAMAAFSLRVQKKISVPGHGVFLEYQQRLQFPFIKSYVPLLPSNILMAGVTIPLRQK